MLVVFFLDKGKCVHLSNVTKMFWALAGLFIIVFTVINKKVSIERICYQSLHNVPAYYKFNIAELELSHNHSLIHGKCSISSRRSTCTL